MPRNRIGLSKVARDGALAALFVALGVTVIVVGIHDATVAEGNLGTLFGAIFLIVLGVVVLFAARELFSKTAADASSCSALVLLAFALQALLGIYVFFSAVESRGPQRPFAVAAGVGLIAAGVYGLHAFRSSIELKSRKVGIATALTVVATLFGFWQFWYQNQYVPAHLGRAVSLGVQLARDGTQTRYDIVRATIDYEALGGQNVVVVGSTYTLTGSRVVRCVRTATPSAVQQVLGGYLADPQRDRFMADVWEEQPPTVLAAGKFVGDGKELDTDVPATRMFVFFVPRDRYQLLRFRVQLYAVPSSIPLVPREKNTRYHGDQDLYAFWTIAHNSWFHDLVDGRSRWLVTRYEDVAEPARTNVTPDFRVTARLPAPTWTAGLPGKATVEALFHKRQPSGTSEPFADAELPLDPVAAPVARDAHKLPSVCRR